MTDVESKLIVFAKWVLAEHREYMADFDGIDIQDKAEALGLFVRKSVDAPCSESCVCAEVGEPPYDCVFLCDGLTL